MSRERLGFVGFFATHQVAGNLLMLLMIVFGLFGLSNLNRQVLPDFKLEVINVTVAWPGASPQDVEENIIEAIEPEVRFITDVDTVKSTAFEGRAELSITFKEGANMSIALTDVQAAISRITTFPSDIESPIVNQLINADEVCRLEISGPFHFSLSAAPELSATGIDLHAKTGDDNINLQKFELQFMLAPLLDGTLQIDRLLVTDMVANLSDPAGENSDSDSGLTPGYFLPALILKSATITILRLQI